MTFPFRIDFFRRIWKVGECNYEVVWSRCLRWCHVRQPRELRQQKCSVVFWSGKSATRLYFIKFTHFKIDSYLNLSFFSQKFCKYSSLEMFYAKENSGFNVSIHLLNSEIQKRLNLKFISTDHSFTFIYKGKLKIHSDYIW